ncbi:AraC family transcriptional regulator [Methylobacterium sp. 10]|uniref:helix-turn-helix transcriptional regulator n=1 Tax=Methylobacterium sp. 10 TaxID=1101191 RepID=UPI000482606E|nr:AraC family transcriptional regulator [Methylobacterium sp. 10]
MSSATVRQSIRLIDGDATYRVAAWQELMKTSGEVRVEPEEARRFTSDSSWRRFGPVMVGRITTTAFSLVRTKEVAERTGLDHVFFNGWESGRGVGACGRRQMAFDVGSLSVTKLSSAAHYHLDDVTFTALVVPRRLLEARMGPVEPINGRVFKPDTPEAMIVASHIRTLLDLPEMLTPAKAALAGRASLLLLAACFSKTVPHLVIGVDPDAEIMKAIRRFIDDHLADPDLDAALICQQFGLSRSRLYRLMSATGDVAGVIRRLRLTRAHREIAARRKTDLPMTEIAACFGFRQERSFRRAFQQAFGYSPADLRARVRSGASTSLPEAGAVVDDWFNDL